MVYKNVRIPFSRIKKLHRICLISRVLISFMHLVSGYSGASIRENQNPDVLYVNPGPTGMFQNISTDKSR
jgi:hypothetical protein